MPVGWRLSCFERNGSFFVLERNERLRKADHCYCYCRGHVFALWTNGVPVLNRDAAFVSVTLRTVPLIGSNSSQLSPFGPYNHSFSHLGLKIITLARLTSSSTPYSQSPCSVSSRLPLTVTRIRLLDYRYGGPALARPLFLPLCSLLLQFFLCTLLHTFYTLKNSFFLLFTLSLTPSP